MQPYEPGVGERLTDWFFDAVWPIVSYVFQGTVLMIASYGLWLIIQRLLR